MTLESPHIERRLQAWAVATYAMFVLAGSMVGCGPGDPTYMLTEDDVPDRMAQCPAETPIGEPACAADFGSVVETASPRDVHRAVLGVWRLCYDSAPDTPQTGPAVPMSLPPHDGLEFTPEGEVYLLFADDAGALQRREGLDFVGELVSPNNSPAEFLAFALDSGFRREARVRTSECPPRLRIKLVTGYSPFLEYAGE